VFAQLCPWDEFEIDETASFFFLFETKRGQDGIGWSHISRDLGIGEIATLSRPKQSVEMCDGVFLVVVWRVLSLALSPDLRAMSCWGRNNYAKRRKSSPDMDGPDIASSLDGHRLVPTSPNDQGGRELLVFLILSPGGIQITADAETRLDSRSAFTHTCINEVQIDAHHVRQMTNAMTQLGIDK
jgi:hypothetical protein